MLPRGFLGTRADVLMDVVIVSLVVILPLMAFSWLKARGRAWDAHKKIQVWLASGLGVAVLLFELDLRLSGGIRTLMAPSRYSGTVTLDSVLYIHLLFSLSTAVLWVVLIVLSLRRFPSPPKPAPFSKAHRRLGMIGMVDMALTGVTGVALYVLGFAF